ncbi:MAG: TAT-variant-translocated molybdopterin oxidoreductase [Gemmataceae bacterium]
MKPTTRAYWKSPAERDADAAFLEAVADEFPEPVPTQPTRSNRRDFLKAAGFAFAGLALAGCSRPPQRLALPLIDQPEGMTPGRPLHYASTCQACSAGCGLLVKCRDGRPIKLEGNPDHALSRGGLCAVGQASLLGLYDRRRLAAPQKSGADSTWAQVDDAIRSGCAGIRRDRGKVRVLSHTILSPTTREQVDRFLSGFRAAGCDVQHVTYDLPSPSAILDAHRETHGVRVLPHYRLERADVLVSFDADFLGTWISPVEFTRAYVANRSFAGDPPRSSLHVQFESRLSLTGAKADQRHRILPGEIGLALTHLAKAIAAPERANVAWMSGSLEPAPIPLDALAQQLWEARGRALVLCGSQAVAEQKLCNLINDMLDAYGATLDIERPSLQKQANDAALHELVEDLKSGQIAGLFLLDCNPVYDLPCGPELAAALRRPTLLSAWCGERLDETAALAQYACPRPHYLASWSDAEPVVGSLSLAQPTFPPVGNTRSVLESLSAWSGELRSARQLVRDHWQRRVFPRQTRERDFDAFWDKATHDGFVEVDVTPFPPREFALGVVHPIPRAERPAEGSLALVCHAGMTMFDGSHAYNPWLHELPDPITKVTWDNYVSLSPATARRLGVDEGAIVRVEADGVTLEAPVILQPGQHDGVAAIPLGYGSKLSERFADIGPRWLEARPTLNENGQVGWNAAPFLLLERTELQCRRRSARLTPTGRRHLVAGTPTHTSRSVPAALAPPGHARRPMIQETTLDGLNAPRPAAVPLPTLWPADHPAAGPRWGMVIDLSKCTGCSACVVACQAENNIPVVGKDEVYRQREMHWLRIDRYYADRPAAAGAAPAGDVDVAFQPMMCQHCGNAPCETVCPVLATVHSSEGLNQQVYNRCVGTRYCANNCPYKVRRFNWFNYPRDDAGENLVLNPDVTVRSRGVMEKCSFCIQRIQEAKIEARRLGLPLDAMNLQTACQQSCPAQAIHFGDLNRPLDPPLAAAGAVAATPGGGPLAGVSALLPRPPQVAQLARDRRAYQVLEELNVQPGVHYLKVVRNRPAEERRHG